jgi:hypothetical protein
MLADLGSDVDTDEDGTMNHLDADIDGDGLINAFDPDDDGDAILDVLDRDANEDTISDSTQTSIDLFFKNIVEWIAVQYELDVLSCRRGSSCNLKLHDQAKTRRRTQQFTNSRSKRTLKRKYL